MAVFTVVDPIELICLSSDIKPAAPNGSTLHFVDTGELYISYDGGWEPDQRLIYALSQV